MNDWDLPNVHGNWTQVLARTVCVFWTTEPPLQPCVVLELEFCKWQYRVMSDAVTQDCWWRAYKLVSPVSFRGRDWIRWICSSGFAFPGQESQHIKCYKWAVSGWRQRSEERKLGRQTLGAGFWHMVLRLNITAHADSVEVHRFMNLEAIKNSRRNRCHMS